MKTIVFDTSSIISIVTNNLLHIMGPLKEKFNGDFMISKAVKKEVIDYPLTTKKFKLEAIMLLDAVAEGRIKIYENEVKKAAELLELVNQIYKTDKGYIKILDLAEIEALSLAIQLNADAYVVDERTMRLLVEDPEKLARLLRHKLHTFIFMNRENLRKVREQIKNVNIVRSTELMVQAFDLGLLDEYITEESKVIHKDLRPMLLEGLLWGLKLRGCSISEDEIDEIMKLQGY